MRVRTLTINSYKSFITTTVIPFSPTFNVFIGPNNCGKTNILDAIAYASAAEDNPERLHHHRSDISLIVELSHDEQRALNTSPTVMVNVKQYNVEAIDARGDRVSQSVQAAIAHSVKSLHYKDFSDFDQILRDYRVFGQTYPQQFSQFIRLMRRYFPEVASAERVTDVEEHQYEPGAAGARTITIERLGGGFRRILVM